MTAHEVQFSDLLPIEGFRKTTDGFLVATPRVARTGVQVYLGKELGMQDRATVRVFRPEEEVFSEASIASYAHRPITMGHPQGGVDSKNWKDVSVGTTGGEILRDGRFVRVSMSVMDAESIERVEGGEHELSMGYSAMIELSDGVTPEGEPYDAIQRSLKMNHLAIVPKARGGSELRIGDYLEQEVEKMAGENAPKTRTVLVDGLPIETTDAGATVIEKLNADKAKLMRDLADAQTAHSVELAKKDADIKRLQDSVLSEAQLAEKVKQRTALISDAAKIAPKLVVDGLSEAQIRRAAVVAHLGDEAINGKDDTYVAVRFDIAVADAAKNGVVDPLTKALKGGFVPVVVGDRSAAEKAYDELLTETANAYKKKEG